MKLNLEGTHSMLRLPLASSALAMAAPALLSLAAVAQSSELPSRAEAEEVCQVVAGEQWWFRGGALSGGVFDVNNDGVPDRVGGRSAGTAHVMIREIASRDGEPMPVNPVGFEWKTYGAYDGAWLPYDGRTYYIGAMDGDGRYRLYLSYVGPDNSEHVICEFAPNVRETLYQQDRDDAEFCRQIGERQPTFLPVETLTVSPSAVEGRSETHLRGRIRVDFDNDGEQEELFKLAHASGAGRGCDFEYYDVVDTAGMLNGREQEHGLLMDIQSANLRERHPGPVCEGNLARWFTHEGRVYLDNRYRGEQPRSPGSEFHEVSVVEEGAVRLVCKGYFRVAHEITRYNDALWHDQPQ